MRPHEDSVRLIIDQSVNATVSGSLSWQGSFVNQNACRPFNNSFTYEINVLEENCQVRHCSHTLACLVGTLMLAPVAGPEPTLIMLCCICIRSCVNMHVIHVPPAMKHRLLVPIKYDPIITGPIKLYKQASVQVINHCRWVYALVANT